MHGHSEETESATQHKSWCLVMLFTDASEHVKSEVFSDVNGQFR